LSHPPGRRNDNPAASIRPTPGPIGGRAAGLPQGSASFHQSRLPEEEAAMYRIFKKTRDRAARGSEGRSRRPRRQRLAGEAPDGPELLSLTSPQDFRVNLNTFGTQFFSDNASSANGMHMAVWGSDDGFVGGNVIKGQLYTASGLRVGSDNLLITFGEGP